jgi:hypothetical protein
MTKKHALYFKPLLLIVTIAVIFFGCKKDEKNAPIMSIAPAPLHIYAAVGDIVIFKINVSTNAKLQRVVIKGQPDNETPMVLLDTAITSKGTTFTYYYKLPLVLAGRSTLVTFEASDENGMSSTDFRRIYVSALPTSQARVLTETTGHRMYSNTSINPDAYNLETNVGEFSLTADSTSRDMQDYSAANTTLSKEWRSPAGGKFVLYNGFDYANATDSTAISAYTTGVKYSVLYNVQVGDIIITKLGSLTANKYAVIRITDIVDAVGKDGDYYEFNIKK